MKSEWLKEFWRYRELFYFLAWRDVKVRYKQTVLGVAWAVIQPFFTMVVFTIFFGKLAKIPSDGMPYPIFSYCALLPWTYFSGALTNSGNSLVTNADLITKVYFPRVIVPSASVLSGLVDFGIATIILFAMIVYYQVQFSLGFLLWPVLVIPLVLLALGVGMVLAALNVSYRDLRYAIPFGIQLWLFLTPVIYPTSLIPERFRPLTAFNPLVGIIEACRASLFPTKEIDWQTLGISTVMVIVIFVVGLLYFKKVERSFADLI
ncbi:MAG: ABC transporter permease [Candidatus Poribacteria bacterium]|nr:ABC transporter permease [Candidatus Poribacteria bacterium]